MQEFWNRAVRVLVGAAAVFATGGCGASPTGGPDPARSTYFKATLAQGAALPFSFRLPGDFAPTYLIEARLVPLDIGRTTDTRIFDDRGGSGTPGGNGRDTTVSTGRMSDIRVFAATPQGGGAQTDSVVVDVVRSGDFLYITRPHPDPTRNLVDTAEYFSGVIVRKLRYYRQLTENPTGTFLTYSTIR
jgi:hypothetical protein